MYAFANGQETERQTRTEDIRASQAAAGVQAGDAWSKGRHWQARIRSAPAARPAPPDPRRLAGAGAFCTSSTMCSQARSLTRSERPPDLAKQPLCAVEADAAMPRLRARRWRCQRGWLGRMGGRSRSRGSRRGRRLLWGRLRSGCAGSPVRPRATRTKRSSFLLS